MVPRSLFYWSQLFSGQLPKGNDYRDLKRTISIIVLDFDLFKGDNRYWRKCFIKDNDTNEKITGLLEIH
jgi:predicted transposase/invertase (TIGR01784 family)